MKKGKIKKNRRFIEIVTGRQLVYKFLISHTGGFTKRRGDLNSAFEKANSPPPPFHLSRKGRLLAKSQCICPQSSKTLFSIRLKRVGVDSFLHFFSLNTGSDGIAYLKRSHLAYYQSGLHD
jgi:hypothetical protein